MYISSCIYRYPSIHTVRHGVVLCPCACMSPYVLGVSHLSIIARVRVYASSVLRSYLECSCRSVKVHSSLCVFIFFFIDEVFIVHIFFSFFYFVELVCFHDDTHTHRERERERERERAMSAAASLHTAS